METGVNWGSLLIIVSLTLTLAALVCTVAAAAGRESCAAPSRIISLLAGGGILLASILLLYYMVASDFRFLYVHGNSSRDLPLAYRVAAFWAGKEGSFLLWLLFLNVFGLLVARRGDRENQIVHAVLLLTQACILVLLIIESPFRYIWSAYPESLAPGQFPADGAGLNPLLKDPWMVIHPPVLFLGYASASVPFGYAISALARNEYRGWIEASRPWLLFSMVALGIGIFLGGYWAYTVLGWGGYWGWDPVENSSLIPWLVAIALVHGVLVQRRHGCLARTNLLLALIYFIMVFYSTWLTRSGVLSDFSVHSFASSDVAAYLLGFLIMFSAGSFALYAARLGSIRCPKLGADLLDWKTMTVYGIMAISMYALIILAGTSMPILSSVFMDRPTNVTEAFYNNFSKPFGILILILMTLGTTLVISGKKYLAGKETIVAAALSVPLGIAINAGHTSNPVAYLFSTVALFVVIRALADLWRARSSALISSRLAHIGTGILVLGIITSGFHTTSVQKQLVQGKEEVIDAMGITFTGYHEEKESTLRFSIRRGAARQEIETAYFFDEKMRSIYKEPHIIAGLLRDVYISPESYESGAAALTRLMIRKGEEKDVGGVRIRFIGFRTEHMTSGEPTTYADITANGHRLSPGMKFTMSDVIFLDSAIPGTDRTVSLQNIDATSKTILLHVTPGSALAIPADSVIITVTGKRLIWLVWLGTVLVATGGGYAFARSLRSR